MGSPVFRAPDLRSSLWMSVCCGNVHSAQYLRSAELLHWTLCLVFGSSRMAMGTCLFSPHVIQTLGHEIRAPGSAGLWGCLDCPWRLVRVRSSPPFSSRRTLVTSAENPCISRRTLHRALGKLQTTTCMARSVNITRQTTNRPCRQTER